MDKRELRKQILAVRNAMSPEERKKGDILVTEKLLGHQWYYKAQKILLFISYGSEIDTSLILEDALNSGRQVFVPKVEGDRMQFYRITSREELQQGYRGILEPTGNTEQYAANPDEGEQTLMIMPGAVFDHRRGRLGYGGGFYDRYLQDKPWLHTIAIGYRCQLTDEELYLEDWDIRPGQIIAL